MIDERFIPAMEQLKIDYENRRSNDGCMLCVTACAVEHEQPFVRMDFRYASHCQFCPWTLYNGTSCFDGAREAGLPDVPGDLRMRCWRDMDAVEKWREMRINQLGEWIERARKER